MNTQTSYRDYIPSNRKTDPETGKPVWPLSFASHDKNQKGNNKCLPPQKN